MKYLLRREAHISTRSTQQKRAMKAHDMASKSSMHSPMLRVCPSYTTVIGMRTLLHPAGCSAARMARNAASGLALGQI
jgi:hypothetical protein